MLILFCKKVVSKYHYQAMKLYRTASSYFFSYVAPSCPPELITGYGDMEISSNKTLDYAM